MGLATVERSAVTLAKRCLSLLLLIWAVGARGSGSNQLSASLDERVSVLLVIGAGGDAEYATNFLQQAVLWQKACDTAGCRQITIGLEPETEPSDHDKLKQALDSEPTDGEDFWLVLIGHGTFDNQEARFNLRGPDVSATELSDWLRPFHRRLAVVNTASASAPFLTVLSGTNRVIVTATRTGREQNFTRFGLEFARAVTRPEADLDKDGQVSLLEAFLSASRQVAEFYKVENRIATEHALIDDNGDKLGTQADWFQGLRAVRKPKENAAIDGLLARQMVLVPSNSESTLTTEQRARRDELERAVFLYREKKSHLGEAEYYASLEKLLMELARIYQAVPSGTNGTPKTDSSRLE